MTKELIAKVTINQSDSGSYFLKDKDLIDIGYPEMREFDRALGQLIRDNPDYTFTSMYDPLKGGFRISWRRNEYRTDESSSD